MQKVSIGIPAYGPQEAKWWSQLVKNVAVLTKSVDLVDILVADSMATDHNRNIIADEFLKSKADWLFWIDADTVIPVGGIERLLKTGKKMVSGLYYGKHPPHTPIAYYIYNNAYRSIDKDNHWERGEILEVDSCGFGAMLTHRSIFEDIKANFIPKMETGGGIILVHKDDIVEGADSGMYDKVVGNVLNKKLIDPTIDVRFPFFALEHGRTEDIWFSEKATRCGYKIYLDTSVECGHLYPRAFEGKDYRMLYGH